MFIKRVGYPRVFTGYPKGKMTVQKPYLNVALKLAN